MVPSGLSSLGCSAGPLGPSQSVDAAGTAASRVSTAHPWGERQLLPCGVPSASGGESLTSRRSAGAHRSYKQRRPGQL